jgi:putative sterol carrier protein
MTIDETFVTMQQLFNPAAAAGVTKTFQWDISGEQAGKWAIKVADQTCELIRGGVDKADITLIMSDQTWLAIAEGKQDPMQAFMQGKVKTQGDMMLAMKLQQLFPRK